MEELYHKPQQQKYRKLSDILSMKGFFFILLILILTQTLGSQSTGSQLTSWPGMGPRIARLAQHLVSTSRVIMEQKPGQSSRNIWVKNTRRYKKANGWIGLMVNGEVIDERHIFIQYGNRIENLQALFTLGSGFMEDLDDYQLDYLGPYDGLPKLP